MTMVMMMLVMMGDEDDATFDDDDDDDVGNINKLYFCRIPSWISERRIGQLIE